MKIEGPKQAGSASSTKKTSKANGASGGFEEFIGIGGGISNSSGPSAAVAPRAIASVDALFAAQSVEDPTEKASKRRMILRADDVLGELDGLHKALLSNSISIDGMVRIADKVSTRREKVSDAGLAEILEEIDLRAQIELAKMRKALDNSPAS